MTLEFIAESWRFDIQGTISLRNVRFFLPYLGTHFLLTEAGKFISSVPLASEAIPWSFPQ
jgi:hypothetical protein